MGKTVIPEVVEYTCDKCNKEIPKDRIDATVRASFDCRDLSGSKCGAISKDYDLCGSCALAFEKWWESE